MPNFNRYNKFDEYGLNHILDHLKSVVADDDLSKVILDVHWHERRRLQDPSNSLLLADTNLCLNYIFENGVCNLPKLISVCFLLTIIEDLNRDTAASKDIAVVLDLSENTSELEKITQFFFEHQEYHLEALLGFWEEYVNLGKIKLAQEFGDKILEKLYVNRQKASYSNHLGYSVLLFDRKIPDDLKTEYQKETLVKLFSEVEPHWRDISTLWFHMKKGDLKTAKFFLDKSYIAIKNHRTALIMLLRPIIEAIRKLYGEQWTASLLDNLHASGTIWGGQRRGGYFAELSRIYSKIENISGALLAFREIPSKFTNITAEVLEELADDLVVAGKFQTAKQVLLESIRQRASAEFSNIVSPAIVKLVYLLGHVELAKEGTEVLNKLSMNFNMVKRLNEIISSYKNVQPTRWLEVIKNHTYKAWDSEIPDTRDIKEYATAFFDLYHGYLMRSYLDAVGIDHAEDVYKDFLEEHYDQLLHIRTPNEIEDGIKRVNHLTEGNLGLVTRALICHAMLGQSREHDKLCHWMKLSTFLSRSSFHFLADDLLIYAPIIGKLDLILDVRLEIERFMKIIPAKKQICGEYLDKVANILSDDLEKASQIQVIKSKGNDLIDEKNSFKMTLDYHLSCTNLDLAEQNLPLIFIGPSETFRIYDVKKDQLPEIQTTLRNHGYEAAFYDSATNA
jgi:hypothetical protein